jgi:hypothetical protein
VTSPISPCATGFKVSGSTILTSIPGSGVPQVLIFASTGSSLLLTDSPYDA